MSIKQKILRFLIENKEKAFSMYEMSKTLKIDYKLVHTNVKSLQNEGSIYVEDLKSQKRCSFKDSFNEEVYYVENERRAEIIKKKEFRAIYDKLKEVNQQFIVLLFGSYASGKETKHSDIDLLLISPEANVKKIDEILSILPFKIHLTNVGYESFIRMLKSKEFSVVSEAIKNNIILFGIEDYYRLIQNAK